MNHPYKYFFDKLDYNESCSDLEDVSVNSIYNVLNETFSQVIFFYELLKNNNVYSNYLSLSTHFLMMDYYYNYKIQLESILFPSFKLIKYPTNFSFCYHEMNKRNLYQFLEKFNTVKLNNSVKWLLLRWIKYSWFIFQKIQSILEEHHISLKNYQYLKQIKNTSYDIYSKIKHKKSYTIKYINFLGGLMDLGGRQKNNFNDFTQYPLIKKKIFSFSISSTCITNLQYFYFIENGGYIDVKYWSTPGWNWKTYNDVFLPKNWVVNNDQENLKKYSINGKYLEEVVNFPINNITYYEAEAYCNYVKGRLPTEEEWEWVCTNRNKTIYPWGIEQIRLYHVNANLKNCDIVSTNSIYYFKSLYGVKGLLGNQWEWCSTNYNINHQKKSDPIEQIYNESRMSEKVLKGGSWCMHKSLLSSKLRFNLYPSCNTFPTGFRVVKNFDKSKV